MNARLQRAPLKRAASRLEEARLWLTFEHCHLGQVGARHVISAVVSREPMDPEGVVWLERVRDTDPWKLKIEWAELLLETYR